MPFFFLINFYFYFDQINKQNCKFKKKTFLQENDQKTNKQTNRQTKSYYKNNMHINMSTLFY